MIYDTNESEMTNISGSYTDTDTHTNTVEEGHIEIVVLARRRR